MTAPVTETQAGRLVKRYLAMCAGTDAGPALALAGGAANTEMVLMGDVDQGVPIPARLVAEAVRRYIMNFPTPPPGSLEWRAWFLVDAVWRRG